MPKKIVHLKATLADINPPIWRRLELPADLSLHGLHRCLQVAFGWTDRHLHDFIVNGQIFSPPDPDGVLEGSDSRKWPLADFEGRVKSFIYTYDFGDNWQHSVEIEAWTESKSKSIQPRCLAGERACPPEDCGGAPGYEELCEALADPNHERYEELREWLEGTNVADQDWNPDYFDLAEANANLLMSSSETHPPS